MLPDDLTAEIRFLVDQGFHGPEAVFQQVASLPTEPGIESVNGATADALRDAIVGAFRAKADAMKDWPARTDCDRLRAAFDALQLQGIVALDNAGLTQDDGRWHAADLAVVRDELGADPTRGYCFYTWNAMARAIDGEGLSLAYATFEEDESGKLARKIATTIVKACRKAGLDVEWDGSPDSFVELPRFVWRRRQSASTEADRREFLAGWELEIRAGYTPVDRLETLDERIHDWFESFADFDATLRARMQAHTAAFIEEERRREATWVDATVNDRITAAFRELDEGGVLASECSGMTIQDGWGYAGVEAEARHRGAVFFHEEDVIDGVGGRGLFLAFGALGVAPAEEAGASQAVGDEVVAALQRNGVSCSWSRAVADRIRIEPFEWCRRRWTAAPAHERIAVAPPPPPTGPTAAEARPPARACGIVVRARRDEGGFDLRRSRRLRACWAERGGRGEPQASHLGLPHIFLPAGMYTSMIPRLASDNIVGEKLEIVRRAVIATRGAAASTPTPPRGA